MKNVYPFLQKGLLTFLLMAGLTASDAHIYPDRKTICYQFNANKLYKKQPCVIQSGGGAGGESEIFLLKNAHYQFDTVYDYDEKTQETTERYQYTIVKGDRWLSTPADFYFRDAKTLKNATDTHLSIDKMLTCYRTKGGKIDICHAN